MFLRKKKKMDHKDTKCGPLYFDLNTGVKIPSVGLGTWKAEPGIVGRAVTAAVKVCLFLFTLLRIEI